MSDNPVLNHVDDYLGLAIEYDASDLHLGAAFPPAWRRFGTLSEIWPDDAPPLTAEDTERLARGFTTDEQWAQIEEKGDLDFAYESDLGRFRASVVKQRLSARLTEVKARGRCV